MTTVIRKMKKFIIPLLALMIFIPIVVGQGAMPHSVIGKVTNPDGSPASGATVNVENLRTGSISVIVTNSNGQYYIDLNALSGGYQNGDEIYVEARLGEYKGSGSIVVSSSNPFEECNVTLSKSSFNLLLLAGIAGVAILIIIVTLFIIKKPARNNETRRRRQ
jgi:hypothetical protein